VPAAYSGVRHVDRPVVGDGDGARVGRRDRGDERRRERRVRPPERVEPQHTPGACVDDEHGVAVRRDRDRVGEAGPRVAQRQVGRRVHEHTSVAARDEQPFVRADREPTRRRRRREDELLPAVERDAQDPAVGRVGDVEPAGVDREPGRAEVGGIVEPWRCEARDAQQLQVAVARRLQRRERGLRPRLEGTREGVAHGWRRQPHST
jgi:hypothetical protein